MERAIALISVAKIRKETKMVFASTFPAMMAWSASKEKVIAFQSA